MRATYLQLLRSAAQNMTGRLSDLAARLAEPAPKVLRIGFSASTIGLVLLKERAELELRFPSTRVQWSEFKEDAAMLSALRSGRLDFCATNGSAACIALAVGLHARVVGAQPAGRSVVSSPPGEYATCTDTAVRSTLVATRRTDFDDHALHLAESPGSPDSNFESARALLVTAADGPSGASDLYLAGVPFAERHPHALLSLFDELNAVTTWSRERSQQAALLLSRTTGMALDVAQEVLSQQPSTPCRTIDSEVRALLQDTADGLAAIGLISRSFDVSIWAWTPEGSAAVRALRSRRRHMNFPAVCRQH